jgi:hypothetical protein
VENAILQIRIEASDAISFMEDVAIEAYIKATDSVNLADIVLTQASMTFTDVVNLNEVVGIEAYTYPADLLNFMETAFKSDAGGTAEILVEDSIILTEIVKINAVMRRIIGIKRLFTPKRVMTNKR